MTLPKAPCHLLDVNVLVALLDEDHIHHQLVTKWFDTPGLQWSICPFTEAGFLRYMTRSGMSAEEATLMLARLSEEPGYHFQPYPVGWGKLCEPILSRIFGHNQITDAFMLGLAIHEKLVLTTLDRAIQHMAGKHQNNVLVIAQS
jgi:uncharacterized protein